MNALKICAGILLSLACFSFGLYFQARLPVAELREPSSIPRPKAEAKFDTKATEAFRSCIDNKVKNGSVTVGKVTVEGRKWAIVSIPCAGDAAKSLFDAVQPYATEEFVRYRDKRRGVVRFFGRLYPPSQCVQLMSDAKGKELEEYSCSIRIDVDSEITEQLKL